MRVIVNPRAIWTPCISGSNKSATVGGIIVGGGGGGATPTLKEVKCLVIT